MPKSAKGNGKSKKSKRGKKSVLTTGRVLLLIVALVLISLISIAVYEILSSAYLVSAPGNDSKNSVEMLSSLGYIQWSEIQKSDLKKVNISYSNPMLYQDGVNLYKSRGRNIAYLMDMEGRVIHNWSSGRTGEDWHQIELDENGDLFAIVKDSELMKLSWNSTILWESKLRYHHYIKLADNGDVYSISRDKFMIPYKTGFIPILDDQLIILSPNGSLKRNISIYDLFGSRIQSKILEKISDNYVKNLASNRAPIMAEDSVYDVFHTNTVEIINKDLAGVARKGNLLICIRNLNLIAIVDVEEGRVIWSWGEDILDGPHGPSLTKEGTILIFDNGMRRKYSRIVELNPATKKIIWEYYGNPNSTFYSETRGGIQELPNGNLLITEANKGHVFELTRNNTLVWDFWNPEVTGDSRAFIYRMTRFSTDDIKPLLLA
jgi:hypothetical protein